MSTRYAFAAHRVFDAAGSPAADALLFGTDHASLFAIDDSTRAVIERWRRATSIDLDAASPEDREVLEALRGARLLVPQDARRPGRVEHDPAQIPLGTLVLEAAQACNLRCTYCYAGGGSYGGAARLMDPALARRAARWLVEASGDRDSVTLVLFGGEPLLNMPAIEAAVLEAEAAAAEHGKTLVVSLTTNGTRFTPAVLAFLRAHPISLSVSIDGPPDLHDANRRFAGSSGTQGGAKGGGTYDAILAGLQTLRAELPRPPAARVTLTPAQWPRVVEVYEHVEQLGFLEVGIAPVSPIDAAMLPTPEQERTLLAGFAQLADRFIEQARHGRLLPFSNLLDVLARLHVGQVKDVPCGAGLGYLAIDSEGRFYLCHRLAGMERFRVGDLEHGVDHARIRASLQEQAAPREDGCSRCWARTLCAGGCHHDNHVRENDLGQSPGGMCDFIRGWLEICIRTYARLRGEADERVLAFLAHRARG